MKLLSILKEFGFDLVLIMAGLSGGLVYLEKGSKLKWWQKLLSVLSGGLIANYVTPIISSWTGHQEFMCGVAFFLGYGGLRGVESFFKIFINKTTGSNLN